MTLRAPVSVPPTVLLGPLITMPEPPLESDRVPVPLKPIQLPRMSVPDAEDAIEIPWLLLPAMRFRSAVNKPPIVLSLLLLLMAMPNLPWLRRSASSVSAM